MNLDRIPPHDADAEKAVLGSLMLDLKLCGEVLEVIAVGDFYADANQRLFMHITRQHFDGRETFDSTLLVSKMKAAGDYDAIGGMGYLAEVASSVPVASNAKHYAEVVAVHSGRRSVIAAGDALTQAGYDESDTDSLADAEAALASIRQRKASTVSTASEAMMALSDDIDAARERQPAIPTGYRQLDDILDGGLHLGELTVLAARPSQGKTALGLCIAMKVATDGGKVLFVSIEMTLLQLAYRLAAMESTVNASALRTGKLSDDERQRLQQAMNTIAATGLVIDDSTSQTVADVASAAKRMASDGGLDLIVVDYLQYMTADDRKLPKHEQLGQIVKGVKALTKDLGCHVLCLAQLNRQGDEVPKLVHLKGSGDIEQDADNVILMHREDNDSGGQTQTNVIVAKQRNGRTGDLILWFDGPTVKFLSTAEAVESGACDWVPPTDEF